VTGTIGQSAANHLSGGNYSIDSGFWGVIAAVQTSGAPLLSVARAGGGVRAFWSSSATGFVVDQSANVSGGWSQVPYPYTTNGSEVSITVPAPTGNRFYRLRKP
jgi:hypothetical protein